VLPFYFTVFPSYSLVFVRGDLVGLFGFSNVDSIGGPINLILVGGTFRVAVAGTSASDIGKERSFRSLRSLYLSASTTDGIPIESTIGLERWVTSLVVTDMSLNAAFLVIVTRYGPAGWSSNLVLPSSSLDALKVNVDKSYDPSRTFSAC
jgi:hypothetical protein